MLRSLLVRLTVLFVAFLVAPAVVPGVVVHGGPLATLRVAALFGVVNALLGPVLRLLTLPLRLLTLGLVSLLVNGVLLAVTAGISGQLDVGGIGSTVLAALVISVVSAVLTRLVRR